jgi:hypothetical protein
MYQATYLELYNFTTDTIRIYIPLTMVRETLLRRLRQQQLKKLSLGIQYGNRIPSLKGIMFRIQLSINKPVPEISNSDCKNFAQTTTWINYVFAYLMIRPLMKKLLLHGNFSRQNVTP